MPKTVKDYLALGFDQAMAEYFAAGRRTIASASANRDFTLTLRFDNGETRLFNCAPLLLPDTVFAPLMDFEVFRRVYLDEQRCPSWDIDPQIDSALVWNNKIDLSPDTCYLESKPLE